MIPNDYESPVLARVALFMRSLQGYDSKTAKFGLRYGAGASTTSAPLFFFQDLVLAPAVIPFSFSRDVVLAPALILFSFFKKAVVKPAFFYR